MNMSVRLFYIALSFLFSVAISLGVIFLFDAQSEALAITTPEENVIDFEEFDLGGNTFLDVGSPLTFTNVGGSGVNIDIVEGADNRIYDLSKYGDHPSITGQALIDWPWPEGTNITGTTILFDKPISDFSLQAGDFGGDDDSPLTVTAYDSSDHVIGMDSVSWGQGQDPPFATLAVHAIGIRKIVYKSGGAYANSTYIDNLDITPRSNVYLPLVLR